LIKLDVLQVLAAIRRVSGFELDDERAKSK